MIFSSPKKFTSLLVLISFTIGTVFAAQQQPCSINAMIEQALATMQKTPDFVQPEARPYAQEFMNYAQQKFNELAPLLTSVKQGVRGLDIDLIAQIKPDAHIIDNIRENVNAFYRSLFDALRAGASLNDMIPLIAPFFTLDATARQKLASILNPWITGIQQIFSSLRIPPKTHVTHILNNYDPMFINPTTWRAQQQIKSLPQHNIACFLKEIFDNFFRIFGQFSPEAAITCLMQDQTFTRNFNKLTQQLKQKLDLSPGTQSYTAPGIIFYFISELFMPDTLFKAYRH